MPNREEKITSGYKLPANRVINTVGPLWGSSNKGSTNATSEIAEALEPYFVRHEKNGGYGAALLSCFDTARELDADAMVIIDSDGQHDPEEIPKLLEP